MNTAVAGKLLPAGDTTKECFQETPKPQTPPQVRKFVRSNQPEPGTIRVHHGKAGDPDMASGLVHGVSTKPSLSISEVLNPTQSSAFQEKLQELGEAVYRSQQKAPLGRSHGHCGGLPAWVDQHTVFGVRGAKGQGAQELLNPPKSRIDVEAEAQDKHELYVKSHNHYFVGERINRKYDMPHFRADTVFGLPTPHHDDGRNLAKTMNWIHADDHPEPDQMGSDFSLLPAEDRKKSVQTFGILPPSDQYGAGELIHRTDPGQTTPLLSLVHAIRHHLKKVNYQFFPTLLRAFSHYDKKGRGLIDLRDLQDVCQEFHLDTSPTVLQQLLDYCDWDGDGHISFLEFSNFLCWKDRMPIRKQEQGLLTGEHVSGSPPSKALLRPEDLEPPEPGSSLRVPRTLVHGRGDPDASTPSSTVIGAVTDHAAGREVRSGGLPSVRTDLPAPRLRSVADRTNYGDCPGVAALLHPHTHAALGVYEQHFLCPRSRNEIAEIFRSIGLDLSQQQFDEAWELASRRSPAGEVSVEDFRQVLRERGAM
ncbi:unnamed protein product [Knipowitschia caucasica]|uniref:EF-hand domain-containing protein n=2 Tax=Knipowitschia caucasica TaxID=637954 RepID=A0AAV2MG09_KNICA